MRARTIAERLGCDLETARRIKRVVDGEEDPRKAPELREVLKGPPFGPVGKRYASMLLFNELLEGFGVEGGANPDDFRDGWDYVNRGDSYSGTVVCVDSHRYPFQFTSLSEARLPRWARG